MPFSIGHHRPLPAIRKSIERKLRIILLRLAIHFSFRMRNRLLLCVKVATLYLDAFKVMLYAIVNRCIDFSFLCKIQVIFFHISIAANANRWKYHRFDNAIPTRQQDTLNGRRWNGILGILFDKTQQSIEIKIPRSHSHITSFVFRP